MFSFLVVLAIVSALLLICFLFSFTRLKNLRNEVARSWNRLDDSLQHRYDHLPKLTEDLKGILSDRRHLLRFALQTCRQAEQFNRLLRQVGGPIYTDISPLLDAEAHLTQALDELSSLATRRLPQDESSVKKTLFEIAKLENSVLSARQTFNDAVARYNRAQLAVPSRWFAGLGQHANIAYYRLKMHSSRT